MKNPTRLCLALFAAAAIAALGGCAAVQTSVAKRNLDVQTKISTSIFVDPVKRANRTVYVDVRSGVMEFDRNAMSRAVRDSFAGNANGYTITDDPDAAQYLLSVFVTTLEKASPTAAEVALKQGFVGDVGAASYAGAALGAGNGGSMNSMVGGGLIGALGTTAANAFVQDVTFMLVADIQVKEKTAAGVIVRKDTKISSKVSDAGTSTQTVSEATNKKDYRTRIVTTANKANLELTEAQDLMFRKTAYAMSSFF
ncbi:MAG: complement resistance protein TraT [Burkholderiales bacterium]|nr:complement resistance protein TraT [Burkholderiales bacterium]